MPADITRQIPGNIPDGIIRNQHLDIGNLPQKLVANEFFECSLTGEASDLYGELGPNLISCKLTDVIFPAGVSHFDAKDTIFVNSQIRNRFDRIMATQCAFRNVTFAGTTFRDTSFTDSTFEGVDFSDCDFSVGAFKNNVFRDCLFIRCKTSNKLFEHCLFFHCRFSAIQLQEGSILQNYGIRLSDTVDLSIYSAETGESLSVSQISPQNRLEAISLSYFYEQNLNESSDLFDIVQLKLEDATKTNVFYIISGIKQLTSFLLFLYDEGELVLFFPLQMYWSIDRFLQSYEGAKLPLNILEALEISSARLRRVYEEVCLSIPPLPTHSLLVEGEYSKADLEDVIHELGISVEVASFHVFNSPSLAQVVSADSFELFLFVTVVLSTRFRAEVDHYHADRKLLDIGTRLLSDGRSNPAAAYQALVALNVPRFIYIRLSARISLSLLGRIRRMILSFLDEGSSRREGAQPGRPITILFIASNPPDTTHLQLGREAGEIDKALRVSGVRHHFHIEQVWSAGERELQDSLLRFRPDIVHLSAHGILSGRLLLEGWNRDIASKEPNRVRPEDDDEIIQGTARIFSIAGVDIRCVVLNACHSAKLAQAIAPYADCVVGMWDSIIDEAAIRFSWSFYNSLAYGKNIKDAFDLAVAQIAAAGYQQSQVPKLLPGRRDPRTVTLIHSKKRRRTE